MEREFKKMTSSDRKEEILKEYNELLQSYQTKREETPDKKMEKKLETEKKVVEKSSSYTADNIIKEIAELKLKIGNSLNEVTEKLMQESGKLKEIQEAIKIESKHLEEIHNIQGTADSLAALLQIQENQKLKFEQEMENEKNQWEMELQEHERMLKERDLNLKKQRDREEEEYKYNLKLARKKEEDLYNEEREKLKKSMLEEKMKFEKEFAEREKMLAEKETESKQLQEKVNKFPDELALAVTNAEKKVRETVEKEAKISAMIREKDFEGDKNLSEHKIRSLEQIIKNQSDQIAQLSNNLNKSTEQVQDIALRAIEGASGSKALERVNKIALEQAKHKDPGK